MLHSIHAGSDIRLAGMALMNHMFSTPLRVLAGIVAVTLIVAGIAPDAGMWRVCVLLCGSCSVIAYGAAIDFGGDWDRGGGRCGGLSGRGGLGINRQLDR